MSSTIALLTDWATFYCERAAHMALWNTKLNLAVALRDTWELLDPQQFPTDSAARAEKAMELVTQVASALPS